MWLESLSLEAFRRRLYSYQKVYCTIELSDSQGPFILQAKLLLKLKTKSDVRDYFDNFGYDHVNDSFFNKLQTMQDYATQQWLL